MFQLGGTQHFLCWQVPFIIILHFSTCNFSDSNFRHCPSQDEWNRVSKICGFLKVFYDTTCIFSSSKYPTSNLYFEVICEIQHCLNKEMKGDDVFLKSMATKIVGKFDKYWSEHSVILAIAVVFDPHFKLQFVEYSYKKLYDDNAMEYIQIYHKLFTLFDEYIKNSSNACSSNPLTSHSYGNDSASQDNDDMDFSKVT
ncbi:hypothetical protein ACSBR2_035256 [Camellia fascicularis]